MTHISPTGLFSPMYGVPHFMVTTDFANGRTDYSHDCRDAAACVAHLLEMIHRDFVRIEIRRPLLYNTRVDWMGCGVILPCASADWGGLKGLLPSNAIVLALAAKFA